MTAASCTAYPCHLFHLVYPTWWLNLTQLFCSVLQGFQSTCTNRTENYLSQLVLRGAQCCFWFSVFIRSKSLCIAILKRRWRFCLLVSKYVGIFSSHYRCIASTYYLLKCTPIVFCTVKLLHHALAYLFPPSDFNCLLLCFSTADVPYDIVTGCNFYLVKLRIQIFQR